MRDLWSRLIMPQQHKFRQARARVIKQLAPEIEGSSIIDVGGALPFWRAVGPILKPGSVRIFNIDEHRTTMFENHHADWLTIELYDGHRLPVNDGEADFVICNSVIEHVPPAQRAHLASEIRRVGKTYIVQTPSPVFPLELHFLMPFVHWLPRSLGRKLVLASPYKLLADANAQDYFDQTHLLSLSELCSYFPGAQVRSEKFLGMPKSNIVIGQA